MLELLADAGAAVEWLGRNELRVHAAEVVKYELDEELCSRIRASILLAGPLLARCRRALVPPPGGDVIGRRWLDTHIDAFQQLGAEITFGRRYDMRADRLAGAHVFLDEGIGSNVLRIEGVERLGGGEYRIGADHIEVASFMALAAVTGGDVTIDDVVPEDMVPITPIFERLGV